MDDIHLKLDIEKLSAGELTGAQAARVEEHCSECAGCATYLRELNVDRKRFLNSHPFTEFTEAPHRKAADPWFQSVLSSLLRPSLVPVYGLLLAIAVITPVLRQNGKSDVRFKGTPGLSFYYERNGTVVQGNPGDLFFADDRIQVLYSSSGSQFIALLSIDTGGTVSLYDPQQESKYCSVAAAKGAGIPFPGSIVLDNSTGPELVVAVFSPDRLERKKVSDWLRQQYTAAGGVGPELERLLREKPPVRGGVVQTLLLRKGA